MGNFWRNFDVLMLMPWKMFFPMCIGCSLASIASATMIYLVFGGGTPINQPLFWTALIMGNLIGFAPFWWTAYHYKPPSKPTGTV